MVSNRVAARDRRRTSTIQLIIEQDFWLEMVDGLAVYGPSLQVCTITPFLRGFHCYICSVHCLFSANISGGELVLDGSRE